MVVFRVTEQTHLNVKKCNLFGVVMFLRIFAPIELPAAVTGEFIWEGKTYELHDGQNHLEIR